MIVISSIIRYFRKTQLWNAKMSNQISKDDWFSILSSHFDIHIGNGGAIDEEAWLPDFEKGKSPHDAFYDEYPEYEVL